jgi:NTE family protein
VKCDAVFEGGGVKGIAFVGAIQETEKRGYSFNQLAGTSAGAITASLLAAGYNGKELEDAILELCLLDLLDVGWTGTIPYVGKGINIIIKKGLYNGDKLEQWVEEKLTKKDILTFGDLPEGKLRIIASDISNGKLMVLPDDLNKYGIEWKSFPISKAVRMSSMIPYFFQPVVLRKKENGKIYILDGGLLSNYPIWLFDSKTIPRWPTFGYRLRASNQTPPAKIWGPVTMTSAILSTMLEAHDRKYIEEHNASRTIFIPTENIRSTDFSISDTQKKLLIDLGREEAKKFFNEWNFQTYIDQHRRVTPSIKIKGLK